jgi:peptidoglycan/LPS O-acetylase OafA/YrhL
MSFSSKADRIPELDGLRGIAIGLVLIWHYLFLLAHVAPRTVLSYALASFRLSWTGVDLFFVLSGFLICGILLDASASVSYFKVFYARRFFRIIPIYVVCLGGAFALSRVIHAGIADRFAWMATDALPWPPYLVFLQNFSMALRNSLGAFGLGATWSLAVEEQFYLTLPSLVRFLTTRRLVIVLVLGIATAPVLRVVLHAIWPEHSTAWFVLTPCRADALLLGALAAVGLREPSCRDWLLRKRLILKLCVVALLAGMGILTMRAPHPDNFLMLSVGFTWQAMFYLSVLVYAVLFTDSYMSRCLRWKWLAWLGSIAYATYLLHQFVLGGIFGAVWSRPPVITNLAELAATLLALVLTLTICHFSWKYFEKPLVRLGHRWNYSEETEQNRFMAAGQAGPEPAECRRYQDSVAQ